MFPLASFNLTITVEEPFTRISCGFTLASIATAAPATNFSFATFPIFPPLIVAPNECVPATVLVALTEQFPLALVLHDEAVRFN